MKIDHMIFNSKKWYEGLMPNYIGKSIINLSSKNIQTYYLDTTSGTMARDQVVHGAFFNSKKVQGQLIELNLIYVKIIDANYQNPWIKLTDLLQNGGVSASLNHALLRRKELVA